MKTLGIFGMSGLAREIGEMAIELGYRPVFIGRDEAECSTWTFGGEIIAESALSNETWDFAIAIGDCAVRRRVAGKHAGKHFPAIIDPAATFSRSQRGVVEAALGAIVFAGARMTCNNAIGKFCLVNLNATIAHDCIVGNFVTISPGANISGNVRLDDECYIGAGAVVNQGTPDAKRVIGARTMIGSGAVVIRDCDPDAVYVGAPARRIK